MDFTFRVAAETDTTTKRLLDRFGVSHRLFKRLVTARLIRVHHQVVANVPVDKGAVVTFTLPIDKAVPPADGDLSVMYEDDNWLVVNKPAGIASVPGPSNPDKSLLNLVAGYIVAQGYHAAQPAVITRLDRDTSGLVLLAKHVLAQARIDRLGVDQVVHKEYLAVVTGIMTPNWGIVNVPIGRADDGIHREVRRDGQRAQTDYQIMQRGTNATLVRCKLLTGRTHQIRVHMAYLGHPLVGDALYGGDTRQRTGQALLAARLTWRDPFTERNIAVECPVPPELHRLVE